MARQATAGACADLNRNGGLRSANPPYELAALADPMRLRIVKSLLARDDCMSCREAAPCPDMAKSTLSNHFRIVREAGLIETSKKGVEHRNVVREADINARFPRLLKTIVGFAE